jgi:ATP-dependent Lon protease
MSDRLLEEILNFVLNNMGNKEMMHLNHYIESRAGFWSRIKELEEKLARSSQIMDAMTKTSQNNYKLTQQVKDIEQQLYQSSKERAELEIAVKALEFYGSPKNWKEDGKDLDDVCIIQTDWEMNGKVESYFCGGKLAREALTKINQK